MWRSAGPLGDKCALSYKEDALTLGSLSWAERRLDGLAEESRTPQSAATGNDVTLPRVGEDGLLAAAGQYVLRAE